MKTGIAHLPLHGGKAPAWLFSRMKLLAAEIVRVILYDFGTPELLRRLSDPFWFQAFGCILGFDWHSSGLTTTACGALKEGLKGMEHELGFFVAGGKGRVSRRTPDEILARGDLLTTNPAPLVYASKMSAKVDSAAVQDGYQLYHHVLFFDREGKWAVVQQGMNEENRYARRYHWLGLEKVDFVCEPHQAVCCDLRGETLNLVAQEGEDNRKGPYDMPRRTRKNRSSDALRELLTSADGSRNETAAFLSRRMGGKSLRKVQQCAFWNLLDKFTLVFNWEFMDRYPPFPIVQQSFLFGLYLLHRQAGREIEDQVLAGHFLRAFPQALEEARRYETPYIKPRDFISICFSLRFLERFCEYFGFVTIRREVIPGDFIKRKFVQTTDFFGQYLQWRV